jgi:Ca2+-binding RTX toxin-like protein
VKVRNLMPVAILASGALLFPGLATAAPSAAGVGPTPGDPASKTLSISTTPGDVQAHALVISYSAGTYTVTDGAGVTGGPGCVTVNASTAICADTVIFVNARGGEGPDSLSLVSLGPGDPALLVASDTGTLGGYGGDDRLLGSPGRDYLRSGAGDDVVLGNEGVDLLQGKAGDDLLDGGGGDDDLRAGPGDDRVVGAAGFDSISGKAGDDRLEGGSGRDRLDGGSGRDQLFGGAGLDQLFARDRRADDDVNCGPGDGPHERARVDANDRSRVSQC